MNTNTRSKTDKTASASQNRAMAKDAAITGLPTLDPNDMPTPAQRRKWAKEYRDAQDGALKLIPAAKTATACQKTPKERLEHIRGELRAERISYDELHELQSLAEFIEPGDVELLEAAGVPEFPESQHEESGCTDYLQHPWESCPENKAQGKPELPQGTPVMCNGYKGTIVRRYSGNMYEVRLSRGVITTADFIVIPQPQAGHSPLPWHIAAEVDGDFAILGNGTDTGRATAAGPITLNAHVAIVEGEANAKLIVASVNHAEVLAEALRGLIESPNSLQSRQDAIEILANWEGVK